MDAADGPRKIDRARVFMAAAAMLLVRATAAGFAFQSDLAMSFGERLSQAALGGVVGLVFFFPLTIVLILLLVGLLTVAARRVMRQVSAGVRPDVAARRGVWLVLGVLSVLEVVSFAVATAGTGEPPTAIELLTWLGAVVVAYPIIQWGVRSPETRHTAQVG